MSAENGYDYGMYYNTVIYWARYVRNNYKNL